MCLHKFKEQRTKKPRDLSQGTNSDFFKYIYIETEIQFFNYKKKKKTARGNLVYFFYILVQCNSETVFLSLIRLLCTYRITDYSIRIDHGRCLISTVRYYAGAFLFSRTYIIFMFLRQPDFTKYLANNTQLMIRSGVVYTVFRNDSRRRDNREEEEGRWPSPRTNPHRLIIFRNFKIFKNKCILNTGFDAS